MIEMTAKAMKKVDKKQNFLLSHVLLGSFQDNK